MRNPPRWFWWSLSRYIYEQPPVITRTPSPRSYCIAYDKSHIIKKATRTMWFQRISGRGNYCYSNIRCMLTQKLYNPTHSIMYHLANSTLQIATLRVWKTQPLTALQCIYSRITIVSHLLKDTCNDFTLILKLWYPQTMIPQLLHTWRHKLIELCTNI